jgi:hypothetical protein
MEGLHNHQFKPRSKMEWSLSWKFLISSSKHLYVKESILFIFKQLMEGYENPFKESFQFLFHTFPKPPVSFLLPIEFLVKNETSLLPKIIKSFLWRRKSISGMVFSVCQ